MRLILHVAEKNDAAREISKILSNGSFSRSESYSKFNKIYKFNRKYAGREYLMSMTSVCGHLTSLDFPPSYRSWSSCDPSELFTVPVLRTVSDSCKNIKKTLEENARQAEMLVIWTDCDREGEHIGYEIVTTCVKVNNSLQILRARFSEITKRSIENAFEQLGELDQRMYEAVEARQELDLRIGVAFSRMQTLYLQRHFPQLSGGVVSYGPCQFPTLGFVVDRYLEVEKFVPEPFWKISVTDNRDSWNVVFDWKRGRLFDKSAVEAIYNLCKHNENAKVIEISSKPKTKYRPYPLDTVELQKAVSKKFKISAKETLDIAEKLYNLGFVSYPRTETNIFPSSMNLNQLVNEQKQSSEWGTFAERVSALGPKPRNGTKSDQAHPPIHPTKFTNTLEGNHAKIYEFIVRSFLACCSDDARGTESHIVISIAEESFSAHGLMITEKNYLEVYPYDKWSDKVLPKYQLHEVFVPTDISMSTGTTEGPQLLSESDLISLMDKYGIGTDATHAEHIEKIKTRHYVAMTENQRFLPSKLGIGLVEAYNTMGFDMAKPSVRANLEAELTRICEGTAQKSGVIGKFIQKYQRIYSSTYQMIKVMLDTLLKYLGPNYDNSQQNAHPRTGFNQSNSSSNGRPDDDDENGYHGPGSNSNRIQTDSLRVKCLCDLPAARRKVMKPGPNQGREFYCCEKSINDERCSFFQFIDSGSHSTSFKNHHRTSLKPSTSKGTGGNASGNKRRLQAELDDNDQPDTGIKKTRKCGLCGRLGHDRRKCPDA